MSPRSDEGAGSPAPETIPESDDLKEHVPDDWLIDEDDLADNLADCIDALREHAWYVKRDGDVKGVLVDVDAFLELFELRDQARTMQKMWDEQGKKPANRQDAAFQSVEGE